MSRQSFSLLGFLQKCVFRHGGPWGRGFDAPIKVGKRSKHPTLPILVGDELSPSEASLKGLRCPDSGNRAGGAVGSRKGAGSTPYSQSEARIGGGRADSGVRAFHPKRMDREGEGDDENKIYIIPKRQRRMGAMTTKTKTNQKSPKSSWFRYFFWNFVQKDSSGDGKNLVFLVTGPKA